MDCDVCGSQTVFNDGHWSFHNLSIKIMMLSLTRRCSF